LALILMVLVGGRASVRNAAETFGLERELMGRWENLTMRGGWRSCQTGEGSGRHHRRHRGPRHSMGKDVSPHGNYWIYCHTHGRFERVELLTVAIVNLGQDVHGGSFPLRREEDVGLVRVTEFKAKIDVARCWTCSRSASGSHGRLLLQYCPRSS